MRNKILISPWHDHGGHIDHWYDLFSTHTHTDFIINGMQEWNLFQNGIYGHNVPDKCDPEEINRVKKENNNTLTIISGRAGDRYPSLADIEETDWYEQYEVVIDQHIKFPSYLFLWYFGREMSQALTGDAFTLPLPDVKKTKLFFCKNRNPHNHRIVMIDEFAWHGLLDNNIVTWLYGSERLHIQQGMGRPFLYWDNPRTLDHDARKDDGFDQLHQTYILGQNECAIEVVTESNMFPFITEKTAHPIFFEHPFIVLGFKGFHSRLQELFGIELYDELFDYSVVDNAPNYHQRARYIAEQLVELNKRDPNDIYETVRAKCKRNLGRYLNMLVTPDVNKPEIMKDIAILNKTLFAPLLQDYNMGVVNLIHQHPYYSDVLKKYQRGEL